MGERTVTVAAGDSLWAIAKRSLGAGHRWPEIYAANREKIRNPNLIRVGQVIRLPDGDRFGAADPHPMQRARPRIAPLAPASSASHITADIGRPPVANPVDTTLVNNPAIKLDLAVMPALEIRVPGAKVKLSWTGQVILWRDGVRPLNMIGNRGLELSEKHHAATVLGELVTSQKLTIGADRRITFEDLMGTVSYGSQNTMVSSGFTMTSSSPLPTYRTQIKTKLRQGKLRNWLFVAHDMTMNFDVELDGQQPPQAPSAQRVAAPVPGRITAEVGVQPSFMDKAGQWVSDHQTAITVVAVTGTVVLAFLTLGGSSLVEAGIFGGTAFLSRLATTPAS
jgi:hypothetical protein